MNNINTENVALKAGKYFLPKTADAYFSVDGVIAFIAKANTAANVAITTTQQQIKGGQANSVIGVITSEKAINVSFTTPEWQPEFLAANIGTTIRFGEQNFYIDDVTYTPDADGKITLAESPADNKIQLELNGGWVTVAVPEGTTEVDLSTYGVKKGDCLSVIGLFPRKGKEISLLVDTDPTIGELVLKSPIFKGTVGKVGIAQYTFPSFSLSGNWTQNFAADASYEITGTPIAVAGEKCGESETYGYYREYIDGDTLDNFVSITAAPSVVELNVDETQQLSVYGVRNALSEKSVLTTGVTFTVAEGGEATATVTADGIVKGVAEGVTTITVAYGKGKYTTTVAVAVTAA